MGIGSLALIDEKRAIISLHNAFCLFDFGTGACHLAGLPHPDAAGNLRLNDGKVDPAKASSGAPWSTLESSRA